MKNEEISLQTKQSIAAVLKDMMLKKPFNKITVSEIIEKSEINRKTFYYHFADIYALLCWMIEQETTAVIKRFSLLENHQLAVKVAFDYVENNSAIINCALDSSARDILHRYFVQSFHDIAIKMICEAEERYHAPLTDDHRDFLATFYSEVISGIIIAWVRGNHQWNRKMVESYITAVFREGLLSILKNHTEKN